MSRINRLEISVRSSEELIGQLFPTRLVGLLCEKAGKEGYAGTNFGTHIAILPEYDVDDGSDRSETAFANIAHEVAHHYWSGNAKVVVMRRDDDDRRRVESTFFRLGEKRLDFVQ